MASEAALRAVVKNSLGLLGKIERVENRCNKGTPDDFYALRWRGQRLAGWLELKQLDAWPAREDTPVRLKIRKEQLIWAEDWVPLCPVHLLAQVGREYFLFHPGRMRRVHLGLPRAAFCAAAVVQGSPFPTKDILQALSEANQL